MEVVERDQLVDENENILHKVVLTVEFLAKQTLPFRSNHDDKVDFSVEDTNRRYFIATLQLLAKGDSILQKTPTLC